MNDLLSPSCFPPFEFSDSLKGLTFKPSKLVNPVGLTSFCNLFLASLQSSLLWLNLPQSSQGVLPPHFQQFVIIWPGFPQGPQLIGFEGSTLLTKPTFSVELTLSLSIIRILGHIFPIT